MCSAHVPASEWLNGNSTERVGVGLVGVEGGGWGGGNGGDRVPCFPTITNNHKISPYEVKKIKFEIRHSM